jgi:YD repeat-containing protein
MLQTSGVNVALASNGSTVTASSTYSSSFPASSVIDGDRKGLNWGGGGGWNDGTNGVWPDWLEIDFPSSQTISEIDVFTLQDNYSSPSDPTLTMQCNSYGIIDFSVQSWDGSNWVSEPGGDVTGNNNVWRQFTFTPIATGKIRVYVTNARAGFSRLTEVEAWTPSQPPTVSITSPSNGANFSAPANITINASASDSDGTISKVEFFQGGTKLGESTSSPYSYQWNAVGQGSYTLTARATDNSGAATTSSAVNISVTAVPGTISGKVTRTDGVTAIASASIRVLQGATVSGTATTNATGDYSVSGLAAGTYSVEASAAGYTTQTQSGTTVTGGATTTVNLSLDAPISYVYDELGRLVGVIDQGGQAAVYSYDAVGNLMSISRLAASQTAIIRFSPGIGVVGTSVTIWGTAFSATASQNTVTFNGTAATVIASSPSQIVTSVPAGATTGPITVTTPAGSATSSTVFTVGSATGAPVITGFSPAIGAIGTPVTITGSGFEAVASNNRLAFDGISGTVNSAASTTLASTTPVAGSGHISLTTPNGTATSSSDYFIAPPPHVATDVGFTGRAAIGGTATVTLSTSTQLGLLIFDGTEGQKVSLSISNISISGAPDVQVLNPDTSLLTHLALSFQTSAYIDTFTLPYTGTFTIAVVPGIGSTAGSMTVTINNAGDLTGAITPGGSPVTVNITVPGQNAYLTFGGTASQRISLLISQCNVCCFSGSQAYVLKPDGTTLASIGLANNFLDVLTLPSTGTYTIVLDPVLNDTGTTTLTLYNVPADATGTLTSGNSLGVNITTPGQNASLTFSATAGQQLSVDLTGSTIQSSGVAVYRPDGTALVSPFIASPGETFIDGTAIPVTGTYTLVIDPFSTNTGSLTATIYLFNDQSGTIATDGTPATVTISTPGQNARMTFSGTAGNFISLDISGATYGSSVNGPASLKIIKPDGTNLVSTAFSTFGNFVDATQLPVTGTYTILIDPASADTGSVTLKPYTFTDVTGTVPIGGASTTVTTTIPGQNAYVTFSGTAGQVVSLHFTGVTMVCLDIGLYTPNLASQIGSLSSQCGSSFDLTNQTLPVSGTYTIALNPQGKAVGNATVSVTSP